jgi:hypothetical protein
LKIHARRQPSNKDGTEDRPLTEALAGGDKDRTNRRFERKIFPMTPQRFELEYFVLRYAPQVAGEDFIDIGLVMIARGAADFGQVCFLNNWAPVLALDTDADIELLEASLKSIGEQIRNSEHREQMLQQMKESFSNVIRLSEPRVCVSENPRAEFEILRAQLLHDKNHSA